MKVKYTKATEESKNAWFKWIKTCPLGKKNRQVVDFVAGFNAGYAEAKNEVKNK